MNKKDYSEINFKVLVPTRLKWGVVADLNEIVSKRVDIEDFNISVEHKND